MTAVPVLLAAMLILGTLQDSAAQGRHMAQSPALDARDLAVEGILPSFAGATGWLNSAPLSAASLRGKVVLVEFWTYTCINWQRVNPYVRAWARKYADSGLVVIGVHSPEFAFEKDVDNVRAQAMTLGVEHPIAIDSNLAVWRAFDNEYWPALYFVDAQGRIRHHHFGEGDYEVSEQVLRKLLAEAGATLPAEGRVSIDLRGTEVPADWTTLKSPENYVGYARTEGFASPGGFVRDKAHVYAQPARLGLNEWALSGDWTMKTGPVVLNRPDGRLAYRFHARDVHLVMGPLNKGATIRFRVLVDGKPPGASHGSDVDEQGNGVVSAQRLYQLIRQPMPISDRGLEIEFLDPGVQLLAFTFG